MTVETTIVSVLETAGLTVYPGSIPANGTYPNVVYQRISTAQIRSHAGVEMERPRFQFSCWGKKYSDSLSTAQVVKNALDLNQIDFKLAVQDSELDLKDVETGLYRKVIDMFIWT
jgi:hypothetical protein